MPKFNVDDEVQSQLKGIIDQMRAKRLSGELPMHEHKLNDEAEKPGDADASQEKQEEQDALEAMLNDKE